MGILLATLDSSIVNIAVPVLQRALHTDFAMVQWVILSYLLVVTTLMLTMGRLGDILGKKPVYLSGMALFTIASVLCGLATDVTTLVIFRSLQAVGAAMLMALGAALITEVFPASERGRALGYIGTLVSIGVVSGPILGGIMLQYLEWNWIFIVNLPIGILGVWMVHRFIPHHRPAGGQTFDYAGALFLLISLMALLLSLTLGQKSHFRDGRILWLLALWLVFLLLFILTELRVAQPMLDLRIFTNRALSINIATGFLSFFSIAGLFILIPYYLESVLRYDTQTAGLLMAVVPLAMGVVAPRAGRLSDQWGTRPLTLVGLAVLSLSYVGAATVSETTDVAGYILRFLPIGIGMGIFQSPNNSAIMGNVPRHRLGIASGLLSISRTLGQTVGVSVLSTIWAYFVLAQSGPGFQLTPTMAPEPAQVYGLKMIFLLVAGVMAFAFLLALWGYLSSKRPGRAVASD